MKILAFDTSGANCSIGLQNDDVINVIERITPKQQTTLLLPLIQQLLNESSLSLQQLDAIGYGCGPGSFTGIRIASCVAQALGLATGLPLMSISSLAALAQTAYLTNGWEKVYVAIHSSANHIYTAKYQVNNKGLMELFDQEQACSITQLPKINQTGWYGVGDGWNLSGGDEVKSELNTINSSLYLNPRAILLLAENKFMQRDWVEVSQAVPNYRR